MSRALAEEKSAFEKIGKLTGGTSFQDPAGFDGGFPDFGYTVTIDGQDIDLYFEYKMDDNAQMSGISTWSYKNNTFYTTRKDDEAQTIINLMRRDQGLKKNAQYMVDIVKGLLGRKIGVEFNSGCLGTNKIRLIKDFDKLVEGRKVLGTIKSTMLGKVFKNIYINKYKKAKIGRPNPSILLMMIDNKIWMLDKDGVTTNQIKMVRKMLDNKSQSIPAMRSVTCTLGVRIIPRSNGSIETKALLKLTNKVSSNLTV